MHHEKDRDIVLLVYVTFLLLSLNVVEAETAVGKRNTQLVLVAGRDESLVKQAGLKVKGQEALRGWRKVDQTEEVQTLVVKLCLSGF